MPANPIPQTVSQEVNPMLALAEVSKFATVAVSLRTAGFTTEAIRFPRDPLALKLLCAFNNVPSDKAPPGWAYHPNEGSVRAWERVAEAAHADCAARFVERVEWLPMSDAPRGRKVLIYSQRWGVTEGLQFDSGKWGIGTFNGQCIAVEPLCWTDHPVAPTDEALAAIEEAE